MGFNSAVKFLLPWVFMGWLLVIMMVRESGRDQHRWPWHVVLACNVGLLRLLISMGLDPSMRLRKLWAKQCGMWMRERAFWPRKWPLLGASVEQLANFAVMHDWLLGYFQHTKTFQVSMPTCTYTYTVDPENVKHILKTNFANYPKGETFHETMEVLLGNGIFNTDGDNWRKQRKTASHEFNRKNLSEFSAVVFRDYALKMAVILHGRHARDPGDGVDMQDLFMRMTLDSICKVGFGVELQSLDPALPEIAFARAFDAANEDATRRFIDPLWRLKRLLHLSSEARLAQSAEALDEFTFGVISARRAELQKAAANSSGGPSLRSDLLSRFISLSDDDDAGSQDYSDKMLRDMVLNFVIAGRDTTAVTLSWFVYMLCLHPDVADDIHAELCQLQNDQPSSSAADDNAVADVPTNVPDRMASFVTLLKYEAVAKLPRLTAAITETIRLYPAVPQDPKGVLQDDVLPDGTRVRRGSLVTYVPYSMGRMTWLWGPDAAEFRPGRWIEPDGTVKKESEFKFTAFQGGSRVCLGKDSAFLQMRITAGLLCRFFRFRLVPGHPVTYRTMAILAMKQGLRVTLEPADLDRLSR